MNSLAAVALLMAAMGGTPDGVVLNFTASWCGPCQQMAPVVSRLQQQGYAIRKVDFDREVDLRRQFGVTSVPTFVVIVRGEERGRFSGAMSESDLRRIAGSIPEKVAAIPVAETKTTNGFKFGSSKQIEAPPPRSALAGKAKASDDATIIRANIGDPVDSNFTSNPMKVSVRLKVTDSKGMDWGSGTIIFSEPGQTLVLTCGHVFRHFDQQARVEVDIFEDTKYQRLEGEVIKYDLKKDIGLVLIRTPKVLPVARVATESARLGDVVTSVGCGGGDPPLLLQHRVSKTTGFVEDLLECTGTPVSGRSGGGLFSSKGEVVGVCILADPNGRSGLYTGLKTIQELLRQSGLRSIDVPAASSLAARALSDDGRAPSLPDLNPEGESAQPIFVDDQPADHLEEAPARSIASRPTTTKPAAKTKIPDNAVVAGPSVESLRETLDAAKGAEVVCIIRDPARPDSASRVVIIHRASERFVADLTGEVEHQVQRTSLPVRNAVASAKTMTPAEEDSLRYRRRR